MDFARFYDWRRQYAIVEMSLAPVKPERCTRVFEELEHAYVAIKGDDGHYRLTPGVDVALAQRKARRIMNELVTDNQRLVRKLVSQLSKRSTAFIEDEDLFQAGCMGFMRALQSFDPEKFSAKKVGASFATYLRHWVRHFMQNSMADQQTIRRPRTYGMPYQIHKRMEKIQQETGRRATPEQLGTWKNGKKELQVTQAQLDSWLADATSIVSLDSVHYGQNLPGGQKYSTNMQEEGGTVATGEIPDSSKSPESLMQRGQLGKKAEEVVATLTDEEKRLVEDIREGVFNSVSANRMKVTEEYARRLRHDLVEKLRLAVEEVS